MHNSLKIGIDAWDLTKPILGVSRYLQNLLKYITAIDSDNEYILYTPQPINLSGMSFADRVEQRVIRGPLNLLSSPKELWKQIWLPYAAKRDHIDVFFIPTYSMPLLMRCPVLLTVHDILNITYPQFATPRQKFSAWMSIKTAHLSDLIVVPSQHSKDELVKHSRCEPDKIHVTYHGCDLNFEPDNPPPPDFEELTAEPYFLCVGADYPRREYPKLIRSFGEILDESNMKFNLVFAGSTNRLSTISEEIKKAGMSGKIHFLEHIDDVKLEYLYSQAYSFIYPSRYEGFGIPVLEAMTAGLPVIVPNTPPMPEVADDAGIYFDPEDPEGMKNSIKRLMVSQELRQKHSEKSRIQAAKFSWEKTAEETLELLKRAAELKNR